MMHWFCERLGPVPLSPLTVLATSIGHPAAISWSTLSDPRLLPRTLDVFV